MANRNLPVRPDLEQLRRQAKELLKAFRADDSDAVAEFREHHPEDVSNADAKLADAQLVIARSCGVPSWPRLVQACKVTDAIYRDDVDGVRELVLKHPHLLHEMARGTEECNWGPPMSYAATLGRDRVIKLLHELGAADLDRAMARAVLQSESSDTARMLHAMGAKYPPESLLWACETHSSAGFEYLLELGAEICDEHGDRMAPVAMLFDTYARNPDGKHRILEIMSERGYELPDTPPMAVHRGRWDLLEPHLDRDPGLLTSTFSFEEIMPREVGCSGKDAMSYAVPMTDLTLLHLCVDCDELELARRLVERGMDVNAKAAMQADGFGGHTPLFLCTVSYPNANGRQRDAAFTRFLLDHGADPNARASIRVLQFDGDARTPHEYRDVTPLSWAEQYFDRRFVNREAMRIIAESGGRA